MKLYEFKEKTGQQAALAEEQDPDWPESGWWFATGTVNLKRGDEPYKGASSDQVFDAIERGDVFIWLADNA
ncbi:hypothetical protein SAMN04488498_1017 [Mesorhizobium albiziae]|uniref:Uncharacterized protein n=1 Tax=Neomesorhizobium albiziae TaxID=335020 RepID=A0A1I3UTF5_9HYPH|nr:hypothetical protein [Mesorhizobium albiziae]GLS28470.1 hypothetical protein GCM10007937_01770 [Mesorhizobium albiziae]SFJ86280.1 hypothetical protein SAMN04488498_1017 [Mesorhizobium albiziae]